MNNLKKTTYIAVLIASIMAIVWLGIEFIKPYTAECAEARLYANDHFRRATKYGDGDNRMLERAGHFANYYEALCD